MDRESDVVGRGVGSMNKVKQKGKGRGRGGSEKVGSGRRGRQGGDEGFLLPCLFKQYIHIYLQNQNFTIHACFIYI